MIERKRRYSMEEHTRRGMQMYEKIVRSQVEAGNHGRIVAIDVETGDFELDDDDMVAALRLIERSPDAQILSIRIGCRGVRHFGGSVSFDR